LFALVAHALLVLALSLGVRWRASEPVGVQAELWAAVPQSAAPQAQAVEPPPPAIKLPVAPPKAPPVSRSEPDPQPAIDAQIALEKEKERKEQQKKQEALERKEREKALAKEQEKQKEKEREKDLEQQKKVQREREQLMEKMRLEKQEQKEQERKQAQEKQRSEAQHNEQVKRILSQAGTAGGAGSGERSAGPSAGYAGRITAAVKPNIVWTQDAPGNPVTEVEVRIASDGAIISRRIIRTSGVRDWDDAVLRAIDRTQRVPLDGGRVISPMTLVIRPQDL
jgi:colicin import membrane protein